MRIRLVHTQTLLLLSAVLLTVLCMGALNAWNLRNGFTDFLASRDVERLEAFTALVSTRAEEAGGMEAMTAQGVNMADLFHAFGGTQQGFAIRPPAPPHERPAPNDMNRPPPHDGTDQGGFFRPPPRPNDSKDAFKNRVAIFGLNGELLLGSVWRATTGPVIERPVLLNGHVVATVRMVKLKPVPSDVETHFLTAQYQSMLVVAAALLLVAAWVARWAAGQVVRPLLQIQTATEQIAQGKLDTRLQTQRSDELGDTMRNINRMTEGLQQLEASRRQWIANMSHELRTPLTVLRGEIDALVDGIHSASPTTLQSLREEVLKLNALVDDLHLLAMADLKALPCYFETLDAVALLQSITQRFALRAQQAGLTLQFETTWLSLSVRWDAKRIEQLLGNLLDNSLRYTHAPGQVVLRLHCQDQLVVIDLEDSAPGLSPAELSRVFEPLYRAEASRSRDAGGSGLGLAIGEQIAKAHHGQLSASASELGGVLFQIQLPLQAAPAA